MTEYDPRGRPVLGDQSIGKNQFFQNYVSNTTSLGIESRMWFSPTWPGKDLPDVISEEQARSMTPRDVDYIEIHYEFDTSRREYRRVVGRKPNDAGVIDYLARRARGDQS
jgi:hypothetical protein